MSQQGVPVDQIPTEQLRQLREQTEQEIQHLQTSLERLAIAHQRFHEMKVSSKEINGDVVGGEVLIPMTSSLYVPGKLSNRKILVDVGTGYYIEKSTDKVVEFAERKKRYIEENMEKLDGVIQQKNHTLQLLTQSLRGRSN